jgi:hypothetical protein
MLLKIVVNVIDRRLWISRQLSFAKEPENTATAADRK